MKSYLERKLADEELGRLLVLADLAKRHGSRAVAVRLLDAACGWCRLARGLLSKYVVDP